MQPGIGDFQEGEDVVRTVLLEEEIIEIGVVQFPRVHEQPRDLAFRQVQAVLPAVPVLKVAVFLDLDIVRNGREVALEPSEYSEAGKGDLTLSRHLPGLVDRVIQECRLFVLSLPVNWHKDMSVTGRWM